MTSCNDIKDRLIHNQSPFPTKDKVLSYTIPIDHSEPLLFCGSSSDSSGVCSTGAKLGANNQDNESLNFIGPDDDPCTGRDSLASFLDEGLGTSLDGVDEVTSPIFPSLVRNDSGAFSSDEGTGGGVAGKVASTSSSSGTHNSSLISHTAAELICWKGIALARSDDTTLSSGAPTSSPAATPTVTSEALPLVNRAIVKEAEKVETQQPAKKATSHQVQRSKNMPLGRQGPQKCTVCEKAFSNASALTKHKLTHSDERRHACTTCGKAFKRQDHLNGHMLTHRNKKPFECKSKGCGKSYCDARSLRRHVENRHGHEMLETMNLTSHKHSNKKFSQIQSKSHQPIAKSQQEPQQELVQFTPVKSEHIENGSDPKDVNSMTESEPMEAKPQAEVIVVAKKEKSKPVEVTSLPKKQLLSPQEGPPVLEKMSDTPPRFTLPREGVPVVVKRENISVFDFDESLEDGTALPYTTTCASVSQLPATVSQKPPQLEKMTSPVIKINNVIDSSKVGQISDIKLIEEWARRLGDSKVALFLSSSPTTVPFSGPLQLSGGTVTATGASHAFIPTNENGIYSFTPISIVPTASSEFSVKRADIFMAGDSAESPRPLYILPTQHLLSTSVSTANTPLPAPEPPLPPSESHHEQFSLKSAIDDCKFKAEPTKSKEKSVIGTALANRIKTKLKASNLKKLGKANSDSKFDNGPASLSEVPVPHSGKQSYPLAAASDTPVLSGDREGETFADLVLVAAQSNPHAEIGTTVPLCMPATSGVENTGGIVWCESPKDIEDDRLSEGGGDGDEKPVECSICCRRFKNTPALNGHMRLHGGYFKKETEGCKKKEVSKDSHHGTPLQTVSVSVRALIEEKIKERRNNLLRLAAEKAASEQAGSSVPTEIINSSNPTTPASCYNGDRAQQEKGFPFNSKPAENKSATIPTISGNTAQQQNSSNQNNQPVKHTNVKLNPGLIPEKDKHCDRTLSDRPRTKLNKAHKLNNSISNSVASVATTATVSLDTTFQDQSNVISAGCANNQREPVTALPTAANGISHDSGVMLPPQLLLRDCIQSTSSDISYPLVDCGMNLDSTPHSFHIIYVDINGETIPVTVDPGTAGKVAELFPMPVSKLSTVPSNENLNDGSTFGNCTGKGVKDALMGCPLPLEPTASLWDWKNSTSSDNADNGFIAQDCTGSFLCSDNGTEPCTKDPVAGGRGYCYTPVLSPNSSFCLTPGPDSPFEVATQNQSLAFMCPSPSIFSYSSVPSIGNIPSTDESIFSPEQPLTNSSITPMNLPQILEPQKSLQLQQPLSLPQQKGQNSIYVNDFETVHGQAKDEATNLPISVGVQPAFLPEQPNSIKASPVMMDCLPPITTFSTIVSNPALSANTSSSNNEKYDNFTNSNKELLFQCSIDNILGSNLIQQNQQTFIPYEVFTSSPIPDRVTDKWIRGKMNKTLKIRLGAQYQAEIPPRAEVATKGRSKRGRSLDEKLWDPNVLNACSYEEAENYLEFACCSAVPGGGMNKEYALHLLMLSKGNIREALLRLMEKLPSLPPKLKSYSYAENQRWSSEEIISFQISLFQVGKDFSRIAKSIGTKCREECVSFYYFWKKVCCSQYHVMKQIWRGRLEQQQLQLSRQNSNILDIISSN